jgi:carbonic anhydrase
MENKKNNSPTNPSREIQKAKSMEPKKDSSKKGSSGEVYKITKKASNEQNNNNNNTNHINKENNIEINQEKNHQSIYNKYPKDDKFHKENKGHKDYKESKAYSKEEKDSSAQVTDKPKSKCIAHAILVKTEKENAESVKRDSTSNNNNNYARAPKGFYYNDLQELMPVFMKKLAQNKNEKLKKNSQQQDQQQQPQCQCIIDENLKNLKSNSSEEKEILERLDSQDSEESDPSSTNADLRELLKKNKEWVKETLKSNPQFLKEMSAPQHPKYLIISCSDSRILTSKILGTLPGELFVHRNIGNIVLAADFNMQSVISYAVENLKVKNIIVLGHTDCGAIKTSLSNKYHGLIDHWLHPVKDIV